MDIEKLKRKYFPRVPWTEDGPVRRVYRARAAGAGVIGTLKSLAEAEGFTEPGQATVTGNAAECFAAFESKAEGGPVGMVFGTESAAHFCDIAVGPPDPEGWQPYLVRSEEGENLTALAHNLGLLQFKKA